jgi:archaellum component FlaG (FlaF/FlaG flagellin family)
MKKLSFLIVLLLPLVLLGQTKTLNINKLIVKKSGEMVSVESEQSFSVVQDSRKPFIFYSTQKEKIGFYLTYKIKGERVKLSRQVFVLSNGKEVKGKRKKDVIFFKTGHQDAISSIVSENILTDKDTLTTYFISFNYELLLK